MIGPRISVIIPIYNVEKYLDRCIESVVNQTYENLEIILVDDGSTDGCPAICDKWAEKDCRITVVHKKNGGLGMARNSGIEIATGDYVFFFDSDDYVDVKTVEKCLNAVNSANAEAVIFSRYDLFEDGTLKETKISDKKTVFSGSSIQNELLPGMFTYDFGFGTSACCKMFDLNLIKNKGIRFKSEKEIISEDSYFIIEYFTYISCAVIIPECLYYYFKRGDSLTRSFNPERRELNNAFLNKSLELIDKNGLPDKLVTKLMSRYHSMTISAVKQIYSSDLSRKRKKTELYKFYNDRILRKTLRREVLMNDGKFVKLFFWLVKIKCYSACSLLLYLRSLKKN